MYWITDINGTIEDNGLFSDELLSFTMNLSRNGGFAIATGKSFKRCEIYFSSFYTSIPSVFENGARIININSKELIQEEFLTLNEKIALIDFINKIKEYSNFYAFFPIWNQNAFTTSDINETIKAIRNNCVSCFYIKCSISPNKILDNLIFNGFNYREIFEININNSYFNITPLGVNKSHSINFLISAYGLNVHSVYFSGDDENDKIVFNELPIPENHKIIVGDNLNMPEKKYIHVHSQNELLELMLRFYNEVP